MKSAGATICTALETAQFKKHSLAVPIKVLFFACDNIIIKKLRTYFKHFFGLEPYLTAIKKSVTVLLLQD